MSRIEVGRIVKPHGIRGELVVEPLSDRPERFEPGAVLHARRRTLVVVASRPHQGRLLVTFDDVDDRTAAERLRGQTLEAAADEAVTESDYYFTSELVGMEVVLGDGRRLGTVASVVELPPAADYDLLEIAHPDGDTWLLPTAGEFVAIREDDDGNVRIVVTSPPEGLVPEEGA
ncbi:MAG: ribosome maturation factor RimM [Nitriliruptorales bacterium]